MLGNIIDIYGNIITLDLSVDISLQTNLNGLHVVFEDENSKIIGEIGDINPKTLKITIVGEIVDDKVFLPGFTNKPSFKATCRLVNYEQLKLILGNPQATDSKEIYFGLSNTYNNYRINVQTNNFFANHFAILGNTGSGKSYAVARLLQNIFNPSVKQPINANFIIFDAYGEYTNAFQDINKVSPQISYNNYTTDPNYSATQLLRIPAWLLGVDDLAHLLGVDNAGQLPIIEKTLKLVLILKSEDESVIQHKNDIIARALMDILVSGRDSSKIRDQITAILTNFNTPSLNLETQLVQPGYTRTLKQLLFVDKANKMQEMEAVVEMINKYVVPGLELKEPDGTVEYSLEDLEHAMELALVSEGVLKSDKVFDSANVLLVRLHSLVNSLSGDYFEYPEMISRNDYIRSLLTTPEGKKAQIVNFNINYIDDRLAKAITKIISKMIFDYNVDKKERASEAFHILIEEAHRYVQNDKDEDVIGYNIFNRITKEGRKYGTLLGLITQRPSELSTTTISQCANFIILRTLHPNDLDYIKNMVPNVSEMMVEQLKILKPGNCMAFGSAFKVPVSMYFEKPNPEPLSRSANLEEVWF